MTKNTKKLSEATRVFSRPFGKALAKSAALGAASTVGKLAVYGAVGAAGFHVYKKHKKNLLAKAKDKLEKFEGKEMKTFGQLREELDTYLVEFTQQGYGKTHGKPHYAHPLHLHLKKGAFHRWLGKSEDEPITSADIQKGLKAGGHAAKMALFAKNERKWHHG